MIAGMAQMRQKHMQIAQVGDNRNFTRSAFHNGLALAFLLAGLFTIAGVCAHAQSFAPNRITAPIRSDQVSVVHGTVHPLVARAQDQGRLSGSTVIRGMSLTFQLSPAQQADLKKLLAAQLTKGSPMYHQWLQPGQFAARYGVSQADLAQVVAWLKSQGFQVGPIPASADRIDFSGTVAQVEAAFQTTMHRYLLHGVQGWANATDISLPRAIANMSLGVRHLNTFRPLPRVRKAPVRMWQNKLISANPQYTVQTNNGPMNFLAPSDIHTIYNVNGLYNANITGTGQTLAIAGQTDITQYESDVKDFRALSGLNASNLPTQVLVPGTGGNQAYASDLEEADLDVEWSGAIAKDATILYVTVGNSPNYGVFDSLQYAIQTPLINNTQYVPVISLSYGNCEQAFAGSDIQTLEQYLQQANAQGQTVITASGDSGSADCDTTGQNSSGQYVGATQGLAAEYPASSQYATGGGGTSFSGDVSNQSQYWSQQNNANNGSALSYIPETTWNDTQTLAELTNIGSLSASGGGVSTLFAKPSWQTGPGVPGDGKRDVPDISFAADPNHDGYVLCTEETTGSGSNVTFSGTSSCAYPVGRGEVPYFDANGSGYLYGGTSIVGPQIAGLITLWNQEKGNSNGIGNVNPIFYESARTTPGAFHDTLTGTNAVVCQQGSPDCIADPNVPNNYVMSCCNAGSGYDLTTGLGSVDATAMGAVWPAVIKVNGSFSLLTSSTTVSVAPGSSAPVTVVLSPLGTFSGVVALACSNLPANVTCSFSPAASVTLAAGTAQNVTLTLSATSAASRTQPRPLGGNSHRWPVEAAFAGMFGWFLIGAGRKRRPFPSRCSSRLAVALVLGLGLAVATGLTACGSSGSPTPTVHPKPAGNAVTITGTSGTTTASTHIQVTIA
ncbi:MAG: protease pro-enzyme activation domain-containing protein [Acidobacteriaceae bacterium]